jgi:hypothetical protein
MSKMILMDEFHLAIKVPRSLDVAACKAISRTLNGRRFQAALRRAVRHVFADYIPLRKVSVTLAR